MRHRVVAALMTGAAAAGLAVALQPHEPVILTGGTSKAVNLARQDRSTQRPATPSARHDGLAPEAASQGVRPSAAEPHSCTGACADELAGKLLDGRMTPPDLDEVFAQAAPVATAVYARPSGPTRLTHRLRREQGLRFEAALVVAASLPERGYEAVWSGLVRSPAPQDRAIAARLASSTDDIDKQVILLVRAYDASVLCQLVGVVDIRTLEKHDPSALRRLRWVAEGGVGTSNARAASAVLAGAPTDRACSGAMARGAP